MIRIDVDTLLRERLPRHYRYIPSPIIRWVERTICQEQLNRMLEVNDGRRNADFCRGVLRHLDITYDVTGSLPESPRCIIVCNHPLGGLDGMMLIDMVARHYGVQPFFIVNDLLMAIEPLRDIFVPVNKHGRQSRAYSDTFDDALASDRPIIIFPAGLVSRRNTAGEIRDLKWQKMFINKAIAGRRDIIPAFFSGRNSNFFYTFAKLRTRLGIKLNFEMLRLPAEVFRCKGQHFSVTIGRPIPFGKLQGGANAKIEAKAIKKIVYNLNPLPWKKKS